MLALVILLKLLKLILCILLSLIIFLMFIPFKYIVNCKIKEDLYLNASVSWLFHLLRIKFIKEGKNFKTCFFIVSKCFSFEKENKHKGKKSKGKKNNLINKENLSKKVIGCAISYFSDILKIISPEIIELKGVYGFYDPSITGILCAFIPILNIIPNAKINLQPVFDDDNMDVEINICGKIILFFIAYRTLKLILKKEIRKLLFKKKSKTIET
jgi:hypothetical protein